MGINERCFKIDKNNAQAMIKGYKFNGKHTHQSIYLDVVKKPFPMLMTLNRSKSKFKPSPFGIAQQPDSFDMVYKYVAFLDSEYFISNELEMWETLCNNGLFNIWLPESPYKRFDNAKSDEKKYRILLLRIYEINEAIDKTDIIFRSDRIDAVDESNTSVTLKKPVVDEVSFSDIKTLLKKSVEPFLRIKNSYTFPDPSEFQRIKSDHFYPDEISTDEQYFEGAKKSITVNAFERNKLARQKCIDHFGIKCQVCGLNFEKRYGNIGKDFIHVHHIKTLSSISKKYRIDPEQDLIPVCPNCHAMLHRTSPVLTPEKLKQMLSSDS